MTEHEFQALERWVLAAAGLAIELRESRGMLLTGSKDLYDRRRKEARQILVQPKETQE